MDISEFNFSEEVKERIDKADPIVLGAVSGMKVLQAALLELLNGED